MMTRSTFLIGLLFALCLTACISDAPHLNPVDPVFGLRINGKVERFYTTSPIEDVLVSLAPTNDLTRTGANGQFSFLAEAGNYRVLCQAEGFAVDSVEVMLNEDIIAEPLIKLNALPEITTIRLNTRHLATFLPPDQYLIEIEAEAADLDGAADISTIWFEIPALGYRDTLARVAPDNGVFISRLDPRSLGRIFLDDFLGLDFNFFTEDLPGAKHQAAARQLIRVIEQTPQTIAPAGAAALPINFTWEPLNLPFQFTYRVEIYANVPIALPPVVEINNIPSGATSVTYDGPLAAGDYYWVLYVVDQSGNSSRSRQSPLSISSP